MKKQTPGNWLGGVLAAVLCLCFLFGGAAAEEQSFVRNEWNYVDQSMDVSHGIPDTANGVLARIKELGRLRVATEPYFAPQEFIDPDKEGDEIYAGADMKLARLIAERMGVELQIVPMDFTDVLRAVNEDECDLAISALSFTPGRAVTNELSKGYYFTDSPASTILVIREEDAENIRSVEDLANRKMAAQRGSLQETVAVERVRNYREFRRLGMTSEVYNAVSSGDVDAGVADMENAQNYIRNNPGAGLMIVEGIQFVLEEQYSGDRIAGKQGETELMYFVNGVIDEVLSENLYMKWYAEAQERADQLDL